MKRVFYILIALSTVVSTATAQDIETFRFITSGYEVSKTTHIEYLNLLISEGKISLDEKNKGIQTYKLGKTTIDNIEYIARVSFAYSNKNKGSHIKQMSFEFMPECKNMFGIKKEHAKNIVKQLNQWFVDTYGVNVGLKAKWNNSAITRRYQIMNKVDNINIIDASHEHNDTTSPFLLQMPITQNKSPKH